MKRKWKPSSGDTDHWRLTERFIRDLESMLRAFLEEES
ncbi:MAG: hypothetical protein ACI9R3_001832 [Verrucomicrobiales bacterium]|jgi:hypothetical protein